MGEIQIKTRKFSRTKLKKKTKASRRKRNHRARTRTNDSSSSSEEEEEEEDDDDDDDNDDDGDDDEGEGEGEGEGDSHGIMLRERDLPYHAHRIYFAGDNCFGSPWRLTHLPPQQVASVVVPQLYAEFACNVTAALVWPTTAADAKAQAFALAAADVQEFELATNGNDNGNGNRQAYQGKAAQLLGGEMSRADRWAEYWSDQGGKSKHSLEHYQSCRRQSW
jgi:hypothetical protein